MYRRHHAGPGGTLFSIAKPASQRRDTPARDRVDRFTQNKSGRGPLRVVFADISGRHAVFVTAKSRHWSHRDTMRKMQRAYVDRLEEAPQGTVMGHSSPLHVFAWTRFTLPSLDSILQRIRQGYLKTVTASALHEKRCASNSFRGPRMDQLARLVTGVLASRGSQ